MDSGVPGHSLAVSPALPSEPSADFDALYERHFDFVWRLLRRLGVPDAGLDDAVQDVFLVVYRRLEEFEHRSTDRTWIAGIAVRIAADERRRLRRKGGLEPLDSELPDGRADPHGAALHAESVRRLYQLLQHLDGERREVFVLAELEQMTAPEIAEAVGIKLNTVYSRLRTARLAFDKALREERRRDP